MSIGYVLRPLREAGQQSGAGWLDVSEECNGPGAKRKANGVCFCACTIQRYRATALARSQIHSVRMCPEASSQHAEPRGVAYLGLGFSSVWSWWLFLPFKELFLKKEALRPSSDQQVTAGYFDERLSVLPELVSRGLVTRVVTTGHVICETTMRQGLECLASLWHKQHKQHYSHIASNMG